MTHPTDWRTGWASRGQCPATPRGISEVVEQGAATCGRQASGSVAGRRGIAARRRGIRRREASVAYFKVMVSMVRTSRSRSRARMSASIESLPPLEHQAAELTVIQRINRTQQIGGQIPLQNDTGTCYDAASESARREAILTSKMPIEVTLIGKSCTRRD